MRYPKVRPPLWGMSRASTSKPSIRWRPASRPEKRHSPRRPVGSTGKNGGDISRDRTSRASPCSGSSTPITAGEEGQPLGVVPVEVTEQDRAPERLAAEQRGDAADPRPGVEDEGRRLPVVGQGEARGVPA